MSIALTITIDTNAEALQALRNGLADRTKLHKHIAGDAEKYFRTHVTTLNRHKTSSGLGASSTKHFEKAATRIEGEHDDTAAIIRIPRDTGLGRAFREFNLTPMNGKKYLTIPAHATTYGKPARLCPHDMTFAIIGGRHHALVFTSGPDKGSVAYWLRKSVKIKQDRSLLPSDDDIRKIATISAQKYFRRVAKNNLG